MARPAQADAAGRVDTTPHLGAAMKCTFIVLLIAAAHLLATMVCSIGEYATSGFLGRFSRPAYPVFESILEVLKFPLLTMVNVGDPRMAPFAFPLLIVNSLLWGLALVLVIGLFRKGMRC